MAQRVQANDVRDVITTGLTDTQIQNWVDIATLITDRYAASCTVVSTAELVKVEQLLTAHLIASTQERERHAVQARSFGDSSVTYGSALTDEGLNGSPYGKQLKMLDVCGSLTNLYKSRARSLYL